MKKLAEAAESYVKSEIELIRKLTGLDKIVTRKIAETWEKINEPTKTN